MSRLLRPVLTDLHEEDIEQFKESDEVVFIGYIRSDNQAAQQSFANIAAKYRDEFSFALVSDEGVLRAQNLASPTVVCHVVEDEATRSLNDFADAESLDSFVTAASRRVIGELTPHNQQRLLDVCNYSTFLLIEKPTCGSSSQSIARLADGLPLRRDRG